MTKTKENCMLDLIISLEMGLAILGVIVAIYLDYIWRK